MSELPETPADEPTIWHDLARVLGPMAARAFMAKFEKPITVHAREAGAGSGRAQFGFQLAKPGLLPTALERDWFSGFVAGYQAAVTLGMSLTMPEETRQ